MKIDYKHCVAAAKKLGENDDCAVKVLAIVTQTPYSKVWSIALTYGRQVRQATSWYAICNTLRALGYKEIKIHKPLRQKNGCRFTMKSIVKILDPKQRYMIYTSEHLAAAINGQIEDWTKDRRRRVIYVWRIVKLK